MTHPTEAELDALVFSLEHDHPDDIDYRACSAAITALRAQLAEVKAEADSWKNRALHQNEVANREGDRADRAEAALAAQIEADGD